MPSVPLPDPRYKAAFGGLGLYTAGEVRRYSDACEAEAKRQTLLALKEELASDPWAVSVVDSRLQALAISQGKTA